MRLGCPFPPKRPGPGKDFMITIISKFKSTCKACKGEIPQGVEIRYDAATKSAFHPECAEPKADLFGGTEAEELADQLGFEKT